LNSEFIIDTNSDSWKQIQFSGKLPYKTTEYFILSKVKIGLKWFVRKEAKADHKEINLLNDLLQKEFEIGQQLSHPNIVNYHYCGLENGNYFIIMDFVDGSTLDEFLISDQHLHIIKQNFLKNYIEDITCAISYLHSKKMIHGDLSPHNIIYSDSLKKMILIDFGHAFYPGYISLGGGTKAYSAPEINNQTQKISAKSDIYSFGKVLQVITKIYKIKKYDNIIKRCIDQNAVNRIANFESLKKELKIHNFKLKLKTRIFKSSLLISLFILIVYGNNYLIKCNKPSTSFHELNEKKTIDVIKKSEKNNLKTEDLTYSNNSQKNKLNNLERTKKVKYDSLINQFDFLPKFKLILLEEDKHNNLINERTKIILECNQNFEIFLRSNKFDKTVETNIKIQYYKLYYNNYLTSDSLISSISNFK
jgi:serine/threonine protein kinase